MQRFGQLLIILALAGGAYWLWRTEPVEIALTSPQARVAADGVQVFLTIENTGGPDVLTTVRSEAGDAVFCCNGRESYAIPAGRNSLLAADGVHITLKNFTGTTDEGTVIPLRLTFENAGELAAAARIIPPSAPMEHAHSTPQPETPVPAINISAVQSGDLWDVQIETTDFSFRNAEEMTPHVQGEGHVHLYLNGLKLGRLYEPSATIGALPTGTHVFTASLYNNVHKPYLQGSNPVSAHVEVRQP